MSDPRQPWEPDPATLGNNWQSMFEQRRTGGAPSPEPSAAPAADAFDDVELPRIDTAEYKPWIIQRGRSRGSMMLALRWFDAKAGLWHGNAITYPSLYAIDSIGSRMVALDFGLRQYVIEGNDLDDLTRQLQQGDVVKIIQYSASIWPTREQGPVVTAIKKI